MEQLCFEGRVARRLSRSKDFRSLAVQSVEARLDEGLRAFCQAWLEEEFTAQCGARRYERVPSRKDIRHSAYPRQVVTSRGVVTVQVPRGRFGRYVFSLFERYSRHTAAFEDAVVESVLAGHSTRKARVFFRKLFGADVVSQQTASRLLRRFDLELACWRNRPLPQSLAVLVLDAVHIKGAQASSKRARPVLVALGVHQDGRQEVLDFAVAYSESQIAWVPFAQRLRNRGLEAIQLIVHDDTNPIATAAAFSWPEALNQTCVFHVLQNLSQALRGHVHRRSIVHEARWLYEAASKEEFERWAREFTKHWRPMLRHPALRQFIRQWSATTQYFSLPRSWWQAAKTTNLLERWFEELRRRLQVFRRPPNEHSCERWVYALIARFNNLEQRVPGWNESHQLS